MKIRESGMPQQADWDAYFDPDTILCELGLTPACGDAVEFGCGYGTFTIPAARRVSGTVHALDIDQDMIAATRRRAAQSGVTNVICALKDFVRDGSGLPDGSADYAMVFNILHHEDPVGLLLEARRNVSLDGRIGVIHWNYDPDTPRGPPMSMRPRPEQCRQWARAAGLVPASDTIALPPHHYGLILARARDGDERT